MQTFSESICVVEAYPPNGRSTRARKNPFSNSGGHWWTGQPYSFFGQPNLNFSSWLIETWTHQKKKSLASWFELGFILIQSQIRWIALSSTTKDGFTTEEGDSGVVEVFAWEWMVFDCNTITLDFDMPLPLGSRQTAKAPFLFCPLLTPGRGCKVSSLASASTTFFWLLCAAMWKMKMCGHKGQCVTVPQTTDPILVFWGWLLGLPHYCLESWFLRFDGGTTHRSERVKC